MRLQRSTPALLGLALLAWVLAPPALDAKQVGIEGHSRYGKAMAVAMAYDPRFAIAYISSSGAGRVKLHGRNYGELEVCRPLDQEARPCRDPGVL